MCDGKTGGTGQHVCVAAAGKVMSSFFHPGAECFKSCGGESGPCPAFCGSKGLCCSKGKPNRDVGCDGSIGGEGPSYTCVQEPKEVCSDMVNLSEVLNMPSYIYL